MKSAGPTTAPGRVPPPPCCSARGWPASRARSRNSTPTEPGPRGAGETGPRGLQGPKPPAAFGRWPTAARPSRVRKCNQVGSGTSPNVEELHKVCGEKKWRAWNDREKGPNAEILQAVGCLYSTEDCSRRTRTHTTNYICKQGLFFVFFEAEDSESRKG